MHQGREASWTRSLGTGNGRGAGALLLGSRTGADERPVKSSRLGVPAKKAVGVEHILRGRLSQRRLHLHRQYECGRLH